jgi:hypothetical protein
MTAAVAGPLVVCAVLIPFRDGFANANAALLLVVIGAAVTQIAIWGRRQQARDGLPTNAEIELPIQYAGRPRGRFLLTASTRISRPDLEQRLVAVALAGQVAAALASPAELDHPSG